MAQRAFCDFDLLIERADQPGRFTTRVLASPAGEAMGEFEGFNPLELENFLLKVGVPRPGVRRADLGPGDLVRQFGASLYDRVFGGDVGERFAVSRAKADNKGKGLRVRLRLAGVPELGPVPWEYLYDEGEASFVALDIGTPLVRYLDVPGGAEALTVEGPLRVLAVVSSPEDLPPLDVAAEQQRMTEALGPLATSVELQFLEDARLSNVQQAVRREAPHVVHFVGHGGFDERAGEGLLLFEDDYGRSLPTAAERFATLLQGRDSIRFVVLNACEGARTPIDDPFGGVAQSLVRRGVPAVVAMQFPISDRAAVAFARELYRALADGSSVDLAVAEARLGIYAEGNDTEWGTPVLYLRSPDAQLFEVTRSAAVVVEPPPAVVSEPEPPPAPKPEARAPDPAPSPETAPAPKPEARAPDPAPVREPDPVLRQPAPEATVRAPAPPPVRRPPPPRPAPVRVAAPSAPAPLLPPPPRQRGRRLQVVIACVGSVLVALFIIGALVGEGDTGVACDDCALEAVRVAEFADPADAPDRLSGAPVFGSDDVVFEVDGASTAGLGAVWQLGWNDEGLVIFADVTDGAFEVAHGFDATQVFKGDSISFEFGPDTRELSRDDALRAGQDLHVMLGPSGDPDVLAGINIAGTDAQGTVVMRSGGVASGVRAITQRSERGYVLAAIVPWNELRVATPSPGAVFGMNLNVSDGDQAGARLARMVSNNPDRRAEQGEPDDAGQTHPGRWNEVVLVDE